MPPQHWPTPFEGSVSCRPIRSGRRHALRISSFDTGSRGIAQVTWSDVSPRLDVEEDFLHAYGFMPRETWALLHPRSDPAQANQRYMPIGLAADVLAFVDHRGLTHPSDLEAQFGRDLSINAWGGNSKATTSALESLRHYGLLRIVKRENGIRVYAVASPPPAALDRGERARQAILLVARLLAPVSIVSLRGALALMARRNQDLGPLAPAMHALVRQGELEREDVDGQTYLWPAPRRDGSDVEVRRDVRLLAPLRSAGVGSAAVRASMGLAVSVRGVYAASTTKTRLLRHAASLGRRDHRLGQCLGTGGHDQRNLRLCWPASRVSAHLSVRSTPRWRDYSASFCGRAKKGKR